MRCTTAIVAFCYLVLATDALPTILAPRCMFWFCSPRYLNEDGIALATPTTASTRPTPSADPDEIDKLNPNAKTKKCDLIEKYTVDWFLENASKEKKPKPATCLFYTYSLSATARNYAKRNGMTTIWDVWPADYYNKKQITTNPLRCIMQDSTSDRPMYFSNMSTAFARMCDVLATVMDLNVTPKTNTFSSVNKKGIWFKSEFPTLKKGYLKNRVDSIEAMSPDGKTVFPYWTRKGVQSTGVDNPIGNKEVEGGGEDEDVNGKDADNDVLGGVSSDGSSEMDKNGEGQGEVYPEWWDEDDVFSDEELMG